MLLFSTEDQGWCRITLIDGDTETELGADLDEIIKQKMISFLSGPLDHDEFKHFLSLMEKHCSFYFRRSDGQPQVFIQDESGTMFWQSVIDPAATLNALTKL